MRRGEVAWLLVLLGTLLLALASVGQNQPPRPHLSALALPDPATPTPTPTPGWWQEMPLSTPALPGLPGLPSVTLSGSGGAGEGPVAFEVVDCPGPQAQIHGMQRQGVWIQVAGQATVAPFGYWKVELSPDGQGWTLLTRQETPVAHGHLMGLNTTTVPAGLYHLRLTVVQTDGNYPPPCDVKIKIKE
jgi:hypothetical protein